ncbi:MAG TPA: PadR family transcriptional regulator [Bauldia sp.]|nr:PadR family transcriptional regulator [Bauldia sp.]
MSRRKVANPLALAVLACLAERPMHPYEMATTMRERHKDEAIKLNYGSLYAVIEALCRNQFITAQETVREGRRPERTVYRLTPAGEHELTDWLSELISEPVKEYTQFEAGLALMPVLSPEEAVRLLQIRMKTLAIAVSKEESVAAHLRETKLPRLFTIDREYAAATRRAELDWITTLIADIREGRLDGLAEWRRFHAHRDGK